MAIRMTARLAGGSGFTSQARRHPFVRYRRVMHEHTVRATISSGIVEGFTRDGVNRWRSIPYARPPAGSLRFRAPQPAESWRGVRYCHGFAYCAPQDRKYTLLGVGKYQPMSEDCLTLNVVAPEGPGDGPAGERLPVMFFVHGGGYMLGSSATPIYDGAALARRGCVYVSVNYRLGPLGCMDLSSLSTPAITIEDNLFLRDLVMALRWVNENISAFGGDPDNVTIFGESAGAQAVATLLAVPSAANLFARVISESPASGFVNSAGVAAELAAEFATLLGVRREDAAAALLAARPSDLVRTMNRQIAMTAQNITGAFPVGLSFGNDLVPLDPVAAMRRGAAHRVPLIVGNNAEEARLFTRFLKLLPTTEPAIEQLLAGTAPETRERITAAYPGYPDSAACIRLGGDLIFGSAAWQIAGAHSKHAPTYVYRYDYAPRTLRWSGLGATHATELFAVFDLYRTKFGSVLTAAADRRSALRVSNDIQARWRAFSRSDLPGADWPVYTDSDRAVMVFDRQTRVEFDPHPDRRQAWEGFSLARRPA
jgi:para-nitrobenzyl esterase